MRAMTDTEIQDLMDRARWGTVCTVSPDHTPYAIEATPYWDGGDICFMINPGGRTRHNLVQNPNVLVKLTLTSSELNWWAGVSCMGTGRLDQNPRAIRKGFDLLGKVMNTDYSRAGRKFAKTPDRSPLLRITIHGRTGRCSAGQGQPFGFKDDLLWLMENR